MITSYFIRGWADFNEIKSYGNNENIIYPGKDINPFKWMFNCEFLVHSSLSEGLPFCFAGSYVLGKSVISSDCNFGPNDILKMENTASCLIYMILGIK